jgi:DNA-binding NarL/FixJ family response regulator
LPKVLIIDDDRASCEALLKSFMSLEGFELLIQTETGDKLAEEAGSYSPDLILLGLTLPSKSLANFVASLKKSAANAYFFLLAEKIDYALEKRALSAGVTAVFAKFDDYEALIRNAQTLFDK